MKIKLFMATVLEHAGGFEQSFVDIARGLAEIPDTEVEIVTMDEKFTSKLGIALSLYFRQNLTKNPMHRISTNDVTAKLGKAKYVKCRSMRELKSTLKKADIIYSKNELIETFIFKFIFGYHALPPIVLICGTTLFYPRTASLQAKLHNRLYGGRVYKFLTNQIKGFHVKNSFDGEILKKLHPDAKIQKISNPFNITALAALGSGQPKIAQPNKFNILWVARLEEEQKGVNELIELIHELNSTELNERIAWNIAGEGTEKPKIVTLAARYANVHYYGHLSKAGVVSLLKQGNLFIMTSRAESFGNTIIEANALSLPAIAYNIPGPSEIIQPGKNGVLVSSHEEYKKTIQSIVTGELNFDDPQSVVKTKFDSSRVCMVIFNSFKELLEQDNVTSMYESKKHQN